MPKTKILYNKRKRETEEDLMFKEKVPSIKRNLRLPAQVLKTLFRDQPPSISQNLEI